MDVRFITCTNAQLSSVSIVNGQLIYVSDRNLTFYDMLDVRHPMSGMQIVQQLPNTADAVENTIYVINSATQSTSYVWNGTTYLPFADGTRSVEITTASYNALSSADKLNGTMYFVTDGTPGTIQ